MNEFTAIAEVFSFFVVRFILPVGFVLATGYLANHWLERSRKKAAEEEARKAAREKPAV